jgi:HK97 family phage portal protein
MPAELLPPTRNVTEQVGVKEALTLSAVYRAISIISVSASQLNIHAYTNGVEVTRLPAWFKQPDYKISRSAFFEQTVISMATKGNAYWLKHSSSGKLMNLSVLNPLDVIVNQDAAGNVLYYGYRDKIYQPEEIQHLSLFRVPGTHVGLSPIQAAQRELRGAIDTRDYAGNWFKESGIPNGVLKSDQVLSPDQAVAAKNAWNATAGAKNGVAVLGNGLSYSPIILSPADAQWLEVQNFNSTAIARLFGVPGSLMFAGTEGTSLTYQNQESEYISFVRFSLMSYLREIEEAFTALLPRGTEARFNVDALLRSDTVTRYTAHKIGIEAGFLTVAEVREIEKLAPLGSTPIV